jgi:hypothetical protein
MAKKVVDKEKKETEKRMRKHYILEKKLVGKSTPKDVVRFGGVATPETILFALHEVKKLMGYEEGNEYMYKIVVVKK